MAPTKAKATYAVTTLSLLTKGLTAIGDAPLVHVCPPRTRETIKAFPAQKGSAAVALLSATTFLALQHG
jgi:hypothetical protein